MKLLKTYITDFLNRAGFYVFAATILSRLLSFFASWIALQFIDNKELGVVLYAWNIISFLLPFVGLGLPQSLIRYGALLETDKDKKSLLYYVVKNGVISSIGLSILTSLIALFYPFDFEYTGLYIALFSIAFIPVFLLETIKIQLRLEHNNKGYAFVEVAYNVTLFLLVFGLSYFFKEKGYVAALISAPTLIAIIFFNRIFVKKSTVIKLKVTDIEFWKYGVFGGLTGVTTTLLFAIDILLIGAILNTPNEVTAYRYISLIPFSLLFLPRVFITTDFVSFTEKIYDKKYIFNYIKSYMLTFIGVSVFLCFFLITFADVFLNYFDPTFISYADSFKILVVGICGILIFRGLFGNLLCSVGHIKMNYYITIFALVINIITNQILIPKYGIIGAAITSASIMWLTGIATCISFLILYKKNEKNK